MIWLPHVELCCILAGLVAFARAASLPQHLPPELGLSPRGKLVVFGDSTSDNGTGAWTVSHHKWPRDHAYYYHRFSNGPVWVENLAEKLGLDLHDYAVGGATSNNSVVQGGTGPDSKIPVPSALDQLERYLQRDDVSSEDVFVIMIGANDIFQFSITGIIPAITHIINTLSEKGAAKFLVASYPNLGHLPYRAFSSIPTSDHLDKLSNTLQVQLLGMRYRFCRVTNIQVGFVDVKTLFRDMLTNPIQYGFDANTANTSCLVGAYSEAPRRLCKFPDRYIFWDEYHPTRVVHRYIASVAWKASQVLCNN